MSAEARFGHADSPFLLRFRLVTAAPSIFQTALLHSCRRPSTFLDDLSVKYSSAGYDGVRPWPACAVLFSFRFCSCFTVLLHALKC